MVDEIWLSFLELDSSLSLVKVFSIPDSSEVITIIDEAVTSINSNKRTATDVLGLIVVFLAQGHSKTINKN